MKVMSLFDGMSCGQIALKKLGANVSEYYASEIDKYAIKVAKENFPNTIHLGDVTTVKREDFNPIYELIIAPPLNNLIVGIGFNLRIAPPLI